VLGHFWPVLASSDDLTFSQNTAMCPPSFRGSTTVSKFLRGALQIGGKLVELGLLPAQDDDEKLADKVYYLDRSGKLKFDRFGNELISTPEKLERQVKQLVS
jgi:hypothetical protein